MLYHVFIFYVILKNRCQDIHLLNQVGVGVVGVEEDIDPIGTHLPQILVILVHSLLLLSPHRLSHLLLYILSHRSHILSFRWLSSNSHMLGYHMLWCHILLFRWLQSYPHPTYLRLHCNLSHLIDQLFIPKEVHTHTHLCRHHMLHLQYLFLRWMVTRLLHSQLILTDLITE